MTSEAGTQLIDEKQLDTDGTNHFRMIGQASTLFIATMLAKIMRWPTWQS
jgi:hypothetical protein